MKIKYSLAVRPKVQTCDHTFAKGVVLFINVSFLYLYTQQHAILQAVKCQSDLCTWQPPTFHSQSSKPFWWLPYLEVIFSTHCEQLDIHVLVQVHVQPATVASFINRRISVITTISCNLSIKLMPKKKRHNLIILAANPRFLANNCPPQ